MRPRAMGVIIQTRGDRSNGAKSVRTICSTILLLFALGASGQESKPADTDLSEEARQAMKRLGQRQLYYTLDTIGSRDHPKAVTRLMQGFPDHTFRGEQPVTREEFVIVLARLLPRSRHIWEITSYRYTPQAFL